ncbi:uncharacterized protein LOC124497091 isoform X2 [Dermatophagoides farinae]|uniref:uncharacterized protein LOC124497091 isoform X2 n=1 Tax=Dermatophagoides farinae TaxID=6954 RepID=UPI003F62026D
MTCSGCLFGLFKFIYVILTFIVLAIHIHYIWFYLANVRDMESFFNHNQFAHFMGIFLGFLFRISGLLSACKEKIALTCTYSLFLVLILLISRQIDIIFAIHAITAIYAMWFVLALKYVRHKKKRRQLRHQIPTSIITGGSGSGRNVSRQSRSSSTTTGTTTIPNTRSSSITVDLLDDPAGRVINVMPSAPSFNESQPPDPTITTTTTGYDSSNNLQPPLYDHVGYPQLNHTPPPSYTELFESKQS